jgi:hypothetical protein
MSHLIHGVMHMPKLNLHSCAHRFISRNSLIELVLMVLVHVRAVIRDKPSTSIQVGSCTHLDAKCKPSRQAYVSTCSGVSHPRKVLHDVSNPFPATSLMIIPTLTSPD